MSHTPENSQHSDATDPKNFPSESPEHLEEPEMSATSETTQVQIRRAPKFANFIVVGASLGLIIALILSIIFDDPNVDETTWQQAFGYLFLPSVAIGGAVFGIVALILDRVSHNREKMVAAEHIQLVEDQSGSSNPEISDNISDKNPSAHDDSSESRNTPGEEQEG